jgi:hypothetical protein
MQRLVALERGIAEQRLEQCQASSGSICQPDGDGAVELDHRRRVEPAKRAVKLCDLRPIRGLFVLRLDLQGCDRSLQLVLAWTLHSHRAPQFGEPIVDPVPIPERAVLRVERDPSPSGVDARGAAGVVQQHQREQAPYLCVVGHQPGEQLPEPDRLVAQLLADQAIALGGSVALVEDEVHDPQHAAQAVG